MQKECPPGKEFVFRMPDGKEVGRAKNLQELANMIKTAPLASVLYHTNAKHFSPWLDMMGEHMLSIKFKLIEGNTEKVRTALLKILK